MRAFLLYRDQDFHLQQKPPSNGLELMQDLELETLLNVMARGDEVFFDVAKSVLLSAVNADLNTIRYRQSILEDCMNNAFVVRDIYDLAVNAIESERKVYRSFLNDYPDAILSRSTDVLRIFVTTLKKLRNIATEHAHRFKSEGLTTFFSRLQRELADEYFSAINEQLKELNFRGGVLISAELGQGSKGSNYVLRRSQTKDYGWLRRILDQWPNFGTFYIDPRDQSGAKALSELRDRGIHLVANALAQSSDHILGFFNLLRTELAFYLGCLNLHGQLCRKGEPICFPSVFTTNECTHSFRELYDVCLALRTEQRVVGNDVNGDNKQLVIITGANQGGKSTFLRSIGLAQLMLQAGMFVGAESFAANICRGVFTHFKREEDKTMKRGKLAEELARMSEIANNVKSSSLLLFNESFAATNEREGSEIARQVVVALAEGRMKIFFVTHLYKFAREIFDKKMEGAIFLRAERRTDGRRTFKLIEGEPLQTSYGKDLYTKIFLSPIPDDEHVTTGSFTHSIDDTAQESAPDAGGSAVAESYDPKPASIRFRNN